MRIRENYIALARVICALAVVMIHTNTCFNEFNVDRCWFFANVIDCGLGFAVPVFIMISGATLLDYRDRYSTKEYFIKRIKKIVVPFLIWSTVAILYIKETNKVGIFFVYLFFVQLFIVYLSIPILSLIKKEYREKVFAILISVLFVFNMIVPTLSNYIFYLLLGYLLGKKDFSYRTKMIIYILAVIGFVAHIGGTYYLSIDAGMIMHTFRGYTNLPSCLSAIGFFVLIKETGRNIYNEQVLRCVNWLSEYTFPVYLLHYYVLQLVIEPLCLDTHTVLYKIITSVIVFGICVLFTWIVRKIPVVQKCFGI